MPEPKLCCVPNKQTPKKAKAQSKKGTTRQLDSSARSRGAPGTVGNMWNLNNASRQPHAALQLLGSGGIQIVTNWAAQNFAHKLRKATNYTAMKSK